MASLASLAAALCLLGAPASGEPGAWVALRWEAVAGAVAYEIQIAPEPSFAAPVVSERVEVTGYRWADIPSERHYWRVRSVDRDGRVGPWSEVKAIAAALAAPDPVSPADGARLAWDNDPATASFACTRSDLLRSYTVELARDPGFGSLEASRTSASPSLSVPLPGLGDFWWRVRGTTHAGRDTAPSRARRLRVEVGAPRPLGPAPTEAVPFGPVRLRWQAWTPVTRWAVEVRLAGKPAWRTEVGSAEAEFVPKEPGRYRWTVAAVGPEGLAGPQSPPRDLEVLPPALLPAPRPIAPGPDEVVGAGDPAAPVAFSWEPVPGAAEYELQAWAAGDLDAAPARAAPAPALSLPLPAGHCAWRARSIDTLGRAGAWSEPRPFFHGLPPSARAEIATGAASLLADGNDSTSVAIRLFDAEGRAVPARSVSVTATAGRIDGLQESDGRWIARYVAPDRAPPSGRSEIVVVDRDFTARAAVELRAVPGRWRVGLLAGWQTNFEAASAPSLSLEVAWRTPGLSERLFFAGRAGTWATSATVPAQPGLPAPLEATARVIPISLLALHEWPLGWVAVHGGAGLGVQLVQVSAGSDSSLEASPSASLVAGGSTGLGPGEVFAEATVSFGRATGDLGQLRTGGLLLGAGYRFRP